MQSAASQLQIHATFPQQRAISNRQNLLKGQICFAVVVGSLSSQQLGCKRQLVSFIQSYKNALKISRRHGITRCPQKNSHHRLSCKLAKLQKNFLRTGDFSLFLRLTCGKIETITCSCSKIKQLRTLNQPRPQTPLAQLVKSRTLGYFYQTSHLQQRLSRQPARNRWGIWKLLCLIPDSWQQSYNAVSTKPGLGTTLKSFFLAEKIAPLVKKQRPAITFNQTGYLQPSLH